MNRFLRIAVFACSAALAAPALAQDFDAGLDAYLAGNYPTAIANFLPLVDQGDASAQFALANMYDNGRGVPQNNVLAHMWHNLGNANGVALGVKNRDIIAKK